MAELPPDRRRVTIHEARHPRRVRPPRGRDPGRRNHRGSLINGAAVHALTNDRDAASRNDHRRAGKAGNGRRCRAGRRERRRQRLLQSRVSGRMH